MSEQAHTRYTGAKPNEASVRRIHVDIGHVDCQCMNSTAGASERPVMIVSTNTTDREAHRNRAVPRDVAVIEQDS